MTIQEINAMPDVGTIQPTPSSKPKNSKKSWITSFIPTAASIAGGALGTLIAPGVGTAIGGSLGGLLGKKAQDITTGQHSGVGSYLTEGAFGALGGLGKAAEASRGAYGALRAGEGLAAAGKTLRYGSEGAAALKGFQGLSAGEKIIEANAANRGRSQLLGRVAKAADKTSQAAMLSQAGGLSRKTAESAVRDVSKMKNLGYSNLEKMANHAEVVTGKNGVLTNARNEFLTNAKPVNATAFKDTVAEQIGKNVDLTPAQTKNINSLMENLSNKYKFAGEGGKFGQTAATNFDAARREIMTAAYKAPRNSATRNTLVDIGNGMREPIEKSMSHIAFSEGQKETVIAALKGKGVNQPKLFNSIRKAKSAGELASLEAPFVTASIMSKEGAESALLTGAKAFDQSSKKLTGALNEAAGGIVTNPAKRAFSSLTGRVANKLAPAVAEAPTTLPAIAGETAKSMAKAQALPRLLQFGSQPTDANTQVDENGQPINTMTTNPDGSPAAGGITSGTLNTNDTSAQNPPNQFEAVNQSLQKAAMQALSSGDTKGLDNIVKVASLFQSMQPKANKVNTNQAKAINSGQNALSMLDNIEHQFTAAGGGQGRVRGDIAGLVAKANINPKLSAYNRLKTDAALQITQALTGGASAARSPQLINQIKDSLPDVTDSPETAQYKLADLRERLQSIMENAVSYPTDTSQINLNDLLQGATQ